MKSSSSGIFETSQGMDNQAQAKSSSKSFPRFADIGPKSARPFFWFLNSLLVATGGQYGTASLLRGWLTGGRSAYPYCFEGIHQPQSPMYSNQAL